MAGDALTFRVAFVVRWLLWAVRFVVIWPLATMALMALLVLWKDNTTPGQLLVQEIDFVRETASVGQFPVSECRFSSSDLPGAEVKEICHYRNVGAAEYARETDRSLKQLVTAFWATLALMYMSFAAGTGKYPVLHGEIRCVRGDRINRNNGDKNEHA
ncbi:TPA: conjugal transfer protein TraP [Escherichia coli]|nr:conjugal transfer protein TraP [Escherichia coli]